MRSRAELNWSNRSAICVFVWGLNKSLKGTRLSQAAQRNMPASHFELLVRLT